MTSIYGFTGTRSGLNDIQKDKIIKLLKEDIQNGKKIEIHHGDCIGADTDFHNICKNLTNIKIIIHPPSNNTMRSFCESENICKPKSYLVRNKDIVDKSDVLIACPFNNIEQLRSGTWATIRYAKQTNKPILLFV